MQYVILLQGIVRW